MPDSKPNPVRAALLKDCAWPLEILKNKISALFSFEGVLHGDFEAWLHQHPHSVPQKEVEAAEGFRGLGILSSHIWTRFPSP